MGTTDITGSPGEFSFYTSKLFAFARSSLRSLPSISIQSIPWSRSSRAIKELILETREFSDWIPVEFSMIPTQTLAGTTRFYLHSVRPDFELYASPVNWDRARHGQRRPPLTVSRAELR